MAAVIAMSSTRNCLLRRILNKPAAPSPVSAPKHKINNMSDTDQTGTQPEAQPAQAATPAQSVVPAAAEASPAAAPAAEPTPTVGAFGTTRGSGLARGKRPASTPASTGPAKSEYTPTSIEVVKTETSFVNPFAPAEAPAPAPVKVEEAPAKPVVEAAPTRHLATQPKPGPRPRSGFAVR